MRDGIALTRAGHPAVVYVHDAFAQAARAQAKALGVPDLHIYVFPQYKPGRPESEEEAKAAQAAEDLPGLLEERHE